MKIFFSFALITGLFFSGCFYDKPKPKNNTKPSWITSNQGGAVGSCGVHMNGTAAQEEAAQNRARTQLAMNKKSVVAANIVDNQQDNGFSNTTNTKVHANISTNVTVSSHIKDSWRDPKTNKYYVWMVAD